MIISNGNVSVVVRFIRGEEEGEEDGEEEGLYMHK